MTGGKIGDEIGWASEETKSGKVLMRRVDWPPPEERAQAREAHANELNRQRALWLADEARQRRWAAKAGGVAGTVARYEAEQLEAAALAAAALVPGFVLGLQAHDKNHQDALEKVRQVEPGQEGYRAVVRTEKAGVAVWSHIETTIKPSIVKDRSPRTAVRRGGGYALDDEVEKRRTKERGVAVLKHEPPPDEAHRDYLPQREEWDKLRGAPVSGSLDRPHSSKTNQAPEQSSFKSKVDSGMMQVWWTSTQRSGTSTGREQRVRTPRGTGRPTRKSRQRGSGGRPTTTSTRRRSRRRGLAPRSRSRSCWGTGTCTTT